MATVSRYETAKGRRYRVRYRTPDNRSTDKRGFRTKRDAERFAANVEVSKLRGEFVDASRSRVTVAELGPSWLASKSAVKPSTHRALESSMRVHVMPRWGRTPIARIDHSAVKTWVGDLHRAGLSPTSIKRALGVLSGILEDAVQDHRLVRNPCRQVPTPRKVRKEHAYLSHQQLQALATEAGDHRLFVLLCGYTGLRWGEAIALRVRDVDLLRRRIHVSRNAVEVGSELMMGTPKTHQRRHVPFPGFLGPELETQSHGKLPDALLFPGPDGGLMRRTRTDERSGGWFAGAVQRSGVPRVTPHDLRHTAASLAIAAGANVKAIQHMLGHKSAAMTLDVYSGLFADDLDAVGVALDAAGAPFMHSG